MSIVPLPVFEADADPHYRDAMNDEEIYARLEPPKTIVVRLGRLYQVAEYPYDGDAKPGCGTRLVARTHRGTEVVEMLTTTCENAGCSKSVTRKEMREYIDASGGKDYPFLTKGKILRVATVEDLNKQAALEKERPRYVKACKTGIKELDLPMKLVDVEPILGDELVTFYYMSEKRVDFRELVKQLAAEFRTRIEMRQVGARDEARLVADYERCGQHCCCKGFLKVLKPVSMKAAKLQKATLDPLKISGRCGRLMCCLRYEDQTYRELKQNLPHKATRVGTSEGPGVVVDSKVLVQLVLVRLEETGNQIAVPVEELMDPDQCPTPAERAAAAAKAAREADPLRGLPVEEVRQRAGRGEGGDGKGRKKGRRRRGGSGGGGGDGRARRQEEFKQRSEAVEAGDKSEATPTKKKRRRRRGPRAGGGAAAGGAGGERPGPGPAASGEGSGGGAGGGGGDKPKRKRRRRRGRGGGGGGGGGGDKPSGEG